MYKYLNRIFIAFSIFLNTVLGGSNNQTFSARNWQRKRDGKLHRVWLIDFVFRNKMHCCERGLNGHAIQLLKTTMNTWALIKKEICGNKVTFLG